MRIEEFLRKGGIRYYLWVVGTEDDKIKIEIKSDAFDGDGDTQTFLVKDNILFPINEE